MTINCAVIGHGYWGRNLVRNVSEAKSLNLCWVMDALEESLHPVAFRYPGVKVTTRLGEVLNDASVELVLIATPVRTHYQIALDAIRAGKHVMVEKPICDSAEKAQHLIDEAAKRKTLLFVDHTFLFTGAVRKMHDLIQSDHLGRLYYYDSERVNLGLFQHDVNVLWDLAVHDLSIMDFVLNKKPVAVSATGIKHLPSHPEDMAFMTLFFEDAFIAHINVNWLAPVKLRRTLIGGEQRMMVFDDLLPDEKLKIYEKGITVGDAANQIMNLRVQYRTGDAFMPKIEGVEALAAEMEHIAACIRGEATPICSGEAGLQIVRTLEAASKSIALRGHPVEL